MTNNKRPSREPAMPQPSTIGPPPRGSFDVCLVGTGVSTGVPMMNHVLAGECPCKDLYRKSDGKSACQDALNPGSKNARSNVSILVRYTPEGATATTTTIMVDAGKTMRPAVLQAFPKLGVVSIDALLLTHSHADAIFGLDDLRDLQQQEELFGDDGKLIGYRVKGGGSGQMRIVSNRQTLRTARTAFPYLATPADFVSPGILRRRVAAFGWEEIPHDDATLNFAGLGVRCFPVYHGGTYISLGFAFGRNADGSRPFVYISDVKALPEKTQQWLDEAPIRVLVVDMLRRTDHTTHFSFDEAVAFVRRMRPSKALFVGMASCEIGDHDEVNAELRALGDAEGLDMQLAHDGQLLDAMPTQQVPTEEWQPCQPCAPVGY